MCLVLFARQAAGSPEHQLRRRCRREYCPLQVTVPVPLPVPPTSASLSLGWMECVSSVSLPCEHTNFACAQVHQLRLRTSARPLTRMHTYACEQSLEEKKTLTQILVNASTQQRSVEIFAAADCVAGRQAAARGLRRASQVRICNFMWCAYGYCK
jgi:hypothetical protein